MEHNFRTQIPIEKLTTAEVDKISYASKILLLGSCFSENIGQKFKYHKFQAVDNPLGILFHPKAIEIFLKRVVLQQLYTEADLGYHNEQYYCFETHSSCSSADKAEMLQALNAKIAETYLFLSTASHLCVTLGTAWVYTHKATEKTVANCHKIPQKEFKKQLLSVSEITASIQAIEKAVKDVNPSCNFIYTVSPVRHLKDGFVENQQSKAHLIAAVHEVVSKQEQSSYFPSYEIMMDDLRDYRFYKTDMLHPNQMAIDYIWDVFKSIWVHETATPTMAHVSEIQKGLAHKPFNPSSAQHKLFLKALAKKQDRLVEAFPFMRF